MGILEYLAIPLMELKRPPPRRLDPPRMFEPEVVVKAPPPLTLANLEGVYSCASWEPNYLHPATYTRIGGRNIYLPWVAAERAGSRTHSKEQKAANAERLLAAHADERATGRWYIDAAPQEAEGVEQQAANRF
jgi:hypothetical protein